MHLNFTMQDTYRTFLNPAEGSFRDRNSRFLAFGYPVESAAQVGEIVNSLRKKYHDARHHCYAYRIQPGKELFRINDDGEPSGTAGKPIYNQIISHDLMNTVIIVVRYFGGTLLGTGGLINAYKSAAGDVINNATVVERFIEDHIQLKFPYEKLNAVMKILKDEELNASNAVYELECTMMIGVRKSASVNVMGKLVGISGLKAELLQND